MSRGPLQLSTVVTPAAAYDLVTLPVVKTLLGITDGSTDAYLALVIGQQSAAVARHCNRPFVVETLLDQIWPWRDGFPCIVRNSPAVLQLARWPIVGTPQVTETIAGVAAPLVAGVDFLADPATGQLTRLGADGTPRAWKAGPVAVHYTAGFATIPFDVVDAVVRMVKAAYFARNRDPMLRSQNVPGVYEAQYWFGAGPASDGALPPDIAGLLDRHRVPVIG